MGGRLGLAVVRFSVINFVVVSFFRFIMACLSVFLFFVVFFSVIDFFVLGFAVVNFTVACTVGFTMVGFTDFVGFARLASGGEMKQCRGCEVGQVLISHDGVPRNVDIEKLVCGENGSRVAKRIVTGNMPFLR